RKTVWLASLDDSSAHDELTARAEQSREAGRPHSRVPSCSGRFPHPRSPEAVGVQPPTPEWGSMLFEGLPFLERAPHVLLAPGLAVTLSCLIVSLAAEGWRRILDPRSQIGGSYS